MTFSWVDRKWCYFPHYWWAWSLHSCICEGEYCLDCVLMYLICVSTLTIYIYWFIVWIRLQELTHLRVVTVLMSFIMLVAILTSIAIVRRILMATSVLKASITLLNVIMKHDFVYFFGSLIDIWLQLYVFLI